MTEKRGKMEPHASQVNPHISTNLIKISSDSDIHHSSSSPRPSPLFRVQDGKTPEKETHPFASYVLTKWNPARTSTRFGLFHTGSSKQLPNCLGGKETKYRTPDFLPYQTAYPLFCQPNAKKSCTFSRTERFLCSRLLLPTGSNSSISPRAQTRPS